MEHPRKVLDRYGFQAKKSLGQNFLYDDAILAKIVALAELDPTDHVLEIGPGLGSLTAALAKSAERVVAVELDNRLLPILEQQLAPHPHVEIVHADILKVNPADLFDRPYMAVANVPYYITGAILRHLLTNVRRPKRIVFTVQKEVAERMTQKPNKMSLLAVSTQFYGSVEIVANLAAGAFWPRPKVASTVVKIDVDSAERDINEKLFFRIAKVGFSQRRKQLKNNLRSLGLPPEQVASSLVAAEIDGQRRAETLTIAEWCTLTRQIEPLLVSG